MKIIKTGFGWIETDIARFPFDIIIYPTGKVENRYQYFLSNNHIIDLKEIKRVLGNSQPKIVIGTGQSGMVRLSREAEEFLALQKIEVYLAPTPQAINIFNQISEPKAGIFHVTC